MHQECTGSIRTACARAASGIVVLVAGIGAYATAICWQLKSGR